MIVPHGREPPQASTHNSLRKFQAPSARKRSENALWAFVRVGAGCHLHTWTVLPRIEYGTLEKVWRIRQNGISLACMGMNT